MKRFSTNLLAAILGLSTIGGGMAELEASCRKGGGYRGYSRPAPAYYPRPVYRQPCPTPVAQPRPLPQPVPQPAPQPQFTPQPQMAQQGTPGATGQLPPAVRRTVAAPGNSVPPQAGTTRPAPTSPAPAPAASANKAQMTALQVLAGLSGGQPQAQPAPEASPEPEQPVSGHIGNWTASLTNGAIVELSLQADGSFNWTATNNGNTSAFDGTYTIENEALTLTRSSDNQRLAGTLTASGDGGFNFKLNGAKDAGLDFARR